MEKKYIYNTKTHTLHIIGYCYHSKSCGDDSKYVTFATEDEAIAHEGRSLRMCKLCSKKRDKNLV